MTIVVLTWPHTTASYKRTKDERERQSTAGGHHASVVPHTQSTHSWRTRNQECGEDRQRQVERGTTVAGSQGDGVCEGKQAHTHVGHRRVHEHPHGAMIRRVA